MIPPYPRRLVGLWLLVYVVAIVWLGRLALVQVVRRDRHLNPTHIDYVRRETLPAAKGELRDRRGKVLARCVDSASVVANPLLIAQPEQVAAQLAPILDVDASQLAAKLARRYRRVALRREVPADILAEIQPLIARGILSVQSSAAGDGAWSILAMPQQVQAAPQQRQALAVILGQPREALDALLAQPVSTVRLAESADAATAERVERLGLPGILAQPNARTMSNIVYLEAVDAAFELRLLDRDSETRQPYIRDEVWAALASLWRGVAEVPDRKVLSRRLKAPFVFVKREIPAALGAALRAKIEAEAIPGVQVDPEYSREYPQGSLARELVGRVDQEERGICGQEAVFDHLTTGVDGYREVTVDGRGRPIRQEHGQRREPVHGKNVELTLDAAIQSYAEEAVASAVNEFDADWGLAMVVDPFTGEILAMANFASEKRGIPSSERCLSLAYEPGSVMKPIVVSSAIEEGITHASEGFYCPGTMRIGGRTLTCIKHHGAETVHGAVRDSCNMVMVQLAQRMGQERLEPMFKNFGLFERTGVGLESQEARGGIFCGNAEGRWGLQKTATVSYGKGIQCSAAELCRAYSAILNGGTLPQLHLVKRLVDRDGRVVVAAPTNAGPQILSEATATAVRAMMRDVIGDPHGTGHGADSALYHLSGKTGTSVAYSSADRRIVSMIGYGPSEQPRLLTLVSVCEPREGQRWGGSTCGAAMRSILERSLQSLGVPALPGAAEASQKKAEAAAAAAAEAEQDAAREAKAKSAERARGQKSDEAKSATARAASRPSRRGSTSPNPRDSRNASARPTTKGADR